MEALVSGHPQDVAAYENSSCMQPLEVKGFEGLLWELTQQQIKTGMQFRISGVPAAATVGIWVENEPPPTGVWGLPAERTSSASSPKKLILSKLSK